MLEGGMDRLGPEVFDLPVPEIRIGYRSAVYFGRAKRILELERPDTVATVQIFQKGDSVLCGMDEALAILRVGAGSWADADEAAEVFERYLAARVDARRLRHGHAEQAVAARERQSAAERQLDGLWVPGFD